MEKIFYVIQESSRTQINLCTQKDGKECGREERSGELSWKDSLKKGKCFGLFFFYFLDFSYSRNPKCFPWIFLWQILNYVDTKRLLWTEKNLEMLSSNLKMIKSDFAIFLSGECLLIICMSLLHPNCPAWKNSFFLGAELLQFFLTSISLEFSLSGPSGTGQFSLLLPRSSSSPDCVLWGSTLSGAEHLSWTPLPVLALPDQLQSLLLDCTHSWYLLQ